MVFFFCASETVPFRWQERRWRPHAPPRVCSLSTRVREEENKAFLSAGGEGKKVYELCNCSQTRVSSATSPPPHPLLRVPRGAGPSHLHTFWKGGKQVRIATCPLLWQEFPPFHCGTHRMHGRDTAAAATPLRGAHQPSPQLAPKEAVREDQSSLGRRRGHHETRREALPRQWRSDAGQWRTMSSPQDVGAVVVREEQRGGARVRGVMAKFGRGIIKQK